MLPKERVHKSVEVLSASGNVAFRLRREWGSSNFLTAQTSANMGFWQPAGILRSSHPKATRPTPGALDFYAQQSIAQPDMSGASRDVERSEPAVLVVWPEKERLESNLRT